MPPAGTGPQVKQIGDGSDFQSFPLSHKGDAVGIAAAANGDVWFTDKTTAQIGRITMNGVVTEFSLPDSHSKPYDIVRGPDGAMWFTDLRFPKIGRITADGVISEIHPSNFSNIYEITIGPDGAFWFTGGARGVGGSALVGRMTTLGQTTSFPIPTAYGIATGPDGNLWVTADTNGHSIFRMTPSGVVTEFKLPDDAEANEITSGPDGKLWFLMYRTSIGYEIGRMTTTGTLKEFPLGPSHVPSDITSAYGSVWYTLGASAGAGIANITEHGTITEHLQQGCDEASDLALATDGNIWFSCYSSIGVYIKRILTVDPNSITFSGCGQTQNVTVSEDNYRHGWIASTSNPAVATVAPGPSGDVFVVTSQGPGSCVILIHDSRKNRVPVNVTVH